MEENNLRGFMKNNYGDDKLDKSQELNESMSIRESSPDDYTRKIRNLGGGQGE